MFFRINDVDIRKACKSPKMRLLSKLLVTLQPQWAPFVENMQSTQLKVKKQPFSVLAPQEPGSVLLRSQLAPQEQGRCSSGALAPEEPGSVLLRSPLRVGAPQEPGSVLLRSTPGSELLRSQGRCSSGAGARGGSCQERPSPTTHCGRKGYAWAAPGFCLSTEKIVTTTPRTPARSVAPGSPRAPHGTPGDGVGP